MDGRAADALRGQEGQFGFVVIQASGVAAAAGAASATPNTMASTLDLIYEWREGRGKTYSRTVFPRPPSEPDLHLSPHPALWR